MFFMLYFWNHSRNTSNVNIEQEAFLNQSMSGKKKSKCPINLALELLGDRWTLLIIRDMMFANKSNFREFLASDEGISSRTLADRLQMLQQVGIVTRHDDPDHKLKAIYRLTPAG